jgi:hypothetical protein
MFEAIQTAMTSIQQNKAPHVPELIGQVRLAISAIGNRKGWSQKEITDLTQLVVKAMIAEFAKQGMIPCISLN